MHRPHVAVPLTTQLLVLLVVAILIPLAFMLDRIRIDALEAEGRAGSRAGWVARRGAQAVGNAYQGAPGTAETTAFADEFWHGTDADRQRFVDTVHLDALSTGASGGSLLDQGSEFLVDPHTGRSLGLRSISLPADFSQTLAHVEDIMSGPRVFHAADMAGHDHVAAWESVPGTPWIVLVFVPAESLLSPIRAQAVQQALVALGTTSLLSGLLFVSWRRLRMRTAQLQQTVGDLQALAAHNAVLQTALVEREHQLHELVARLFSAQEEERRHVAIDVHDGVAQTAAATHQRLESLAAVYRPRSPQNRHDLQRARELARRTVQEARRIIAGLRPTVLDDFGLGAALQQLAEHLRADGLEVSVDVRLGAERLAPVVETALYRVAQEATTNVRKHAAADRVELGLHHADGVLRLTIADNGRGFDPSGSVPDGPLGERVGIDGMQERLALLGGRLVVDSRPGGGTRVNAELTLRTSPGTCQVAGLGVVHGDRSLAINL